MDRRTQAADLGAQRLVWLTARRRALLSGNTRETKRATDELQNINRQILAAGPQQKDVTE